MCIRDRHRIKDCIPVEIGFTEERWFCLRIPALLPKKAGGSADYIRSFLYPAMRAFFEKRPPVRYQDCVLIYRHVYDRARPERKMRDHDNIEINMVSDIVAMYVIDVYKRQELYQAYTDYNGMMDLTENLYRHVAQEAVSYTHLDVYKRQGLL